MSKSSRKLVRDHFGVRVKKKKKEDHFRVGDHFGARTATRNCEQYTILNNRDFDFGRRMLDGFECFFNNTADHCDSAFHLGFTIPTR